MNPLNLLKFTGGGTTPCHPFNQDLFFPFAMNLKIKCLMEISIVTQQDLQQLKTDLLASITQMKEELLENRSPKQPEVQLLKSHQVQRMLGISPGTLQNLRVNGTLPYSKVGGVIFYDKNEILRIIEENKRNI